MKHAETVTFGGSGLNRAAELRGPDAQARLMADPASRVTYMWRGKSVFSGAADGPLSLVWTDLKHPLAQTVGPRMFLGLEDDGSARFAQDVSTWEPDDLPDTLNQFLDPSEQVHPDLPEGRFAELRATMTRLTPRDAELAATARGIMEWHRTHAFCANCGQGSDVAMAGWQRNCPSCGRHHFPRTDPVVIMLITHGNSVLLGRSPGWPEGMYSLLAGFLEPGETVEAAVRREVFEEAGVRVGQVDYLASQPWPFPASLMIGCHGHATTKEIRIDPNEIEDALWLTKEELADVFEGCHPVVNPARNGAIAHFLMQRWLQDSLN